MKGTNGDLLFVIDGRCDGLLRKDDSILIDEIKSTAMELGLITEKLFPVHWAQAKCYAYMYAKTHGIDRIHIQLTYVHVETEQHRGLFRRRKSGSLSIS
jgi:DNA excision repair protein ERCC-2